MNSLRFEIVGYRRGAGGLNSQAGLRGRKSRVENVLANEADTLDVPEQNELKEDTHEHGDPVPQEIAVAPVDDKKLSKENVDVIEIKE